MYQFKRLYKTEEIVGSGQLVFRKYSNEPVTEEIDERFVAFVERTIPEITASDFGNITTVPAYCLYGGNVVTGEYLKVTLPDSVTIIEDYALNNGTISEIVFSSNITTIKNNSCIGTTNISCIYDFSKAKRVPILESSSSDTYPQFPVGGTNSRPIIKVPSALYNSWVNSAGWSSKADYVISV